MVVNEVSIVGSRCGPFEPALKMLKEGKKEEVAKILNQRSVVERKGDELIAIDYVDKFKKDFAQLATKISAGNPVAFRENSSRSYMRKSALHTTVGNSQSILHAILIRP